MKLQIIFAVCLCLVSANGYIPHEKATYKDRRIRDIQSKYAEYSTGYPTTNERQIVTLAERHRDSSRRVRTDPPDHTKLIPMARYVLHNADWASVATISTLPLIKGFPFANVKSIVDGSLANSTGIPYFYMAPADFTARDLMQNSRATVQVSLEESRYCDSQKWDPEDPRCTRLMLSGKMKRIKVNTTEFQFAQAALFERHPDMVNWPKDHDWFVAKLKIAQIAMVDWFGGAKFIPVRDYLAYNYTGNEIMEIATRLQARNEVTYV